MGIRSGRGRHLNRLGVAYQYINVEQDQQASEWVKQQNDGKERKPTVKIGRAGVGGAQ